MNCSHCQRAFKKGDEIVNSKAQGGGGSYVHEGCHLDWVLRWDNYYYITYEELMGETKDD